MTVNVGVDEPTAGSASQAPVIEGRNISKSFGAVSALRDVSLEVDKGEVLGLIGDNAAGKSTLIKILTGFQQPTRGQIFLDGKLVTLSSVAEARAHGIETVFQDLALIDTLPVYLNLYLNKEPRFGPFLRRSVMQENSRRYLDDIGIQIGSVNDEVASLSRSGRRHRRAHHRLQQRSPSFVAAALTASVFRPQSATMSGASGRSKNLPADRHAWECDAPMKA
jgi:ABC-type Fe3+/spermidine/putrescine transport system ATPase subunit